MIAARKLLFLHLPANALLLWLGYEWLGVGESTRLRLFVSALEALANKNIIRRVDLGHSHTHYEMEKKHHHHVVCTDCGDVEDVVACPLPVLGTRQKPQVKQRRGRLFRIKGLSAGFAVHA